MAEQVRTVRLGTRGSALARWQTDYVAGLLHQAWPALQVEVEVITTHGDVTLDTPLPLIGGKGVFTAELEAALRAGSIDFAVHSLKDLPTETPSGLTIGAIPRRADPRDSLISRGRYTLETLPQGATVGTSSRRRSAQLLAERPDLQLADIRGNIDTRIRKALDANGPYDAIVLATAGVERLSQMDVVSQLLPLTIMLPAPGQAALAVQCRSDEASLTLIAPLNDLETQIAVTAERAFLDGLGGGCSLPIAAYAQIDGDTLHLHSRVSAPDGSRQIDVDGDGEATVAAAQSLGRVLAKRALAQGAGELIGSEQ